MLDFDWSTGQTTEQTECQAFSPVVLIETPHPFTRRRVFPPLVPFGSLQLNDIRVSRDPLVADPRPCRRLPSSTHRPSPPFPGRRMDSSGSSLINQSEYQLILLGIDYSCCIDIKTFVTVRVKISSPSCLQRHCLQFLEQLLLSLMYIVHV